MPDIVTEPSKRRRRSPLAAVARVAERDSIVVHALDEQDERADTRHGELLEELRGWRTAGTRLALAGLAAGLLVVVVCLLIVGETRGVASDRISISAARLVPGSPAYAQSDEPAGGKD